MKKGDIIASLVLGAIFGLFLAFILTGLNFPLFSPWILPFIMPIVVLAGIYLAELIGKKIPFIFQFGKFVVIGLTNTAVDVGILNVLMVLTQTYSGKNIFLLNSVSFVVAVIHSYFWNKLWTFKVKRTDATKEFLQFLVVSVVGLLINGTIVYMITTWINPMFDFSAVSWANAAKITATVISLVWNFIGYKFIVFKKSENQVVSGQGQNPNA